MSAENGGRGKPPVPPEGHGPPERQEIAIAKEIIQPSLMTSARKEGDVLFLSFVVIEEGRAIQYTWTVEEQGQKNIMDAQTGGIQVADLADIPKAKT